MDPLDNSSLFLKNIKGFIWFRSNEKFELTSIEGSVEEITGYGKKDFLSGRIKLTDLVLPEYKHVTEKKNTTTGIGSDSNSSLKYEYRIQRKDGAIKWVREVLQGFSENSNSDKKQITGFIQDITDIKNEEEVLKEREQAELRKFHGIIKNNLEILSVLLGLQANRFTDKEIADAFIKSQNHINSTALIHEELNKERRKNNLNIAAYLEKLSFKVLDSHASEAQNIELKFDLEHVYLESDTAISLGMIVNELILNSLKHVFSLQGKGEILISFHKIENSKSNKTSESNKNPELDRNPEGKSEISNEQSRFLKTESMEKAEFILTVSDNGKGISGDFDLWSAKTLEFQIITSLIAQIGGSIELIRNNGTKFIIKFYSYFESSPGVE